MRVFRSGRFHMDRVGRVLYSADPMVCPCNDRAARFIRAVPCLNEKVGCFSNYTKQPSHGFFGSPSDLGQPKQYMVC